MICRKGRPGIGRPRYECFGRIEYGTGFCDQPSIPRELVDEPFLAHLLDGYIDMKATLRRIEEQISAAVKLARDAFDLKHAEALKLETRRVAIKDDYIDGRITAEKWTLLEVELDRKIENARTAEGECAERVQEAEQTRLFVDAQQWLFDRLAALKRAAAGAAGAAPDRDAQRNVIGQMFERVVLVSGDFEATMRASRVEGAAARLHPLRRGALPEGRRQRGLPGPGLQLVCGRQAPVGGDSAGAAHN